MSDEKIFSCRLIDNEIDYIDDHYDGKFSDFVHNSIKNAIKDQNNNIHSQLFKDFSLYVVIIALGFVFFLFSINYSTMLEKVLCYIIGIFMTTFGITGGFLIALQSARRSNTR